MKKLLFCILILISCFPFVFSWQDYNFDSENSAISDISISILNVTQNSITTGMQYQPLVSDLDYDGKQEIIIFSENKIKIFDKNLNLIIEKQVGELQGQFDIVNYDLDDYLEIIAVLTNNNLDYYTVLQYNGNEIQIVNSFDVTSQGSYQNIKCIDFDNDEVIDCLYKDFYGVIHSYNRNSLNKFDDNLNIDISSSGADSINNVPSFADFDNDNDLDLLIEHNNVIYLIDHNKNIKSFNLSGFFQRYKVYPWSTIYYQGCADANRYLRFADLDGGDLEIIWLGSCSSTTLTPSILRPESYLIAINPDMSLRFKKSCMWTTDWVDYAWKTGFHACRYTDPLIFDYDNDGFDEIGILHEYNEDTIRPTSYDGHGKISYLGMNIEYIDSDGSLINKFKTEKCDISKYYWLKGCMDFFGASFADMNDDSVLDWITPYGVYTLNASLIYDYHNDTIGATVPPKPTQTPIPTDFGLVFSKNNLTKLFKSEEEEQESLLEKYAPVLYFHPDEQFFPTVIDAMLNESDLKLNRFLWPDETIDSLPVSVNSLIDENVNEDYYLDMRGASGGYEITKSYLIPNPDRFYPFPLSIYGRIFNLENVNSLVLQYWFFYPYNDWRNKHEGDWEMIQIIFNDSNEQINPNQVTYSYHNGGLTSNWTQIEKVDNTHPKIYVTLGGHGSWSNVGSHSWAQKLRNIYCTNFYDETSSDGIVLSYDDYILTEIDDGTSWVHFPGRWGEIGSEGTSGPNSPANIAYGDVPNRWTNPIGWAENPMPSSYTACTGSPVNLHVYDSDGNHVGLDDNGSITLDVSNTYLYIPSDDGQELISILSNEDLTFVIEATDSGNFNFSINKYNRDDSSNINLEFKDIQITNKTIATINIEDTNPNFVLNIDEDGDGLVDETKEPDNIEIEGEYNNPETDSDNDGYSDSIDNCPELYNPNQITDFDDDGFDNILCGGLDCDDNNALVNPDSIEVCDNIDNNCNNEIDENLQITYGVDIGECEFGIKTCIAGKYEITTPSIDPVNEICDNLNNDCDDEVDEVDVDDDNFNDCNGEDLCINTVPDAFVDLKSNHYAGIWQGCSCKQILDCKPGNNKGELKNGCTKGTIDIWIKQVGWAKNC